ncbi:P-loop containing nucleoside triphosphate hydrolase protein [Pelagophyceae sp. CCMP2097]|nr:P-loop containing nucleoside triphosphate hydrolase protein [Pelagophyceae sp. CCMP2097]
MDAGALGQLAECKAAWGAAWATLDAATRNEHWRLRRCGEEGWRPAVDAGAAAPPDTPPPAAAQSDAPPPDAPPPSTSAVPCGDAPLAAPGDAADALGGLFGRLDVAAETAAADAVGGADAAAEATADAAGADDDDLGGLFEKLGVSEAVDEAPSVADAEGSAWATLRDYQKTMVLSIERELASASNRGKRAYASVLASLPTGGGKTRVAAALAERGGGATLFVVNRAVLAGQTVAAMAPFLDASQDVAGAAAGAVGGAGRVVVTTIQALRARKLLEARADDAAGPPALAQFGLVILDEAHGAAADSYLSLLFRALRPGTRVVGLTATPHRLDRDDVLGSAFGGFVSGPGLADLVRRGALVPALVVRADLAAKLQKHAAPDCAALKTNDDAVADPVKALSLTHAAAVRRAAGLWLSVAEAQPAPFRTVAFCTTVAQSKVLCQVFCNRGIRAEHLDGNAPAKIRDAMLARLAAGEADVVTNVGCLAEGFDEPQLRCVLMLRATTSRTLFAQQVGRVLRAAPGKERGFVLDVTVNTRTHAAVLRSVAEDADAKALQQDGGKRAAAIAAALFGTTAPDAAPGPAGALRVDAQGENDYRRPNVRAAPRTGKGSPPPPPPTGLAALGRRAQTPRAPLAAATAAHAPAANEA